MPRLRTAAGRGASQRARNDRRVHPPGCNGSTGTGSVTRPPLPAVWAALSRAAGERALLRDALPGDGVAATTAGAVTCGDLFAGIGGMSLGLERAGFTVRWQVEREPFCENILARHFPRVVRRRDVRFAGATILEPVDLIAGGFPCQDISTAGKGGGLGGHRSGLWREFARIVGELRPRWVLVENVPALRRRGADTVLGDLEAAGYTAWPLVVGARHVGAPHRRDRVWIVGHAQERDGTEDRSGSRPQGRRDRAHEAGARVADAERGGVRDESGGSGWPCRSGAAFPAPPGEPQHDWEEPRTVESPLGRAAHGVSARLARARWRAELKALGNAVVPQVVEVIGRAIMEIERRNREWT
jgi:DNA (cytosine-5)-methyltransferase 1